jgi:hypothetical protein
MTAAALLRRSRRFAAQTEHPDWTRIARLLQESYRELAQALASANV